MAHSSKKSNPLTPAQKRSLTNLEGALERVTTWEGEGKQPLFSDLLGEPRPRGSEISQARRSDIEQFVKDLRGYSQAVIRVTRSGLLSIEELKNNPAIKAAKEWIAVRRALGNREALRMARSGLEKRVQNPLSPEELVFLNAVFERLDSGDYRTWVAIQNDMTNRGLLPKMSLWAFLKRLDHAGVDSEKRHVAMLHKRLKPHR